MDRGGSLRPAFHFAPSRYARKVRAHNPAMLPVFALFATILGQTPNPHPRTEQPVWPQYYVRPIHGVSVSGIDVTVRVTGRSGSITVPVPSHFEGQTTVSLSVHTDPAGALRSWRWIDRPDGLNSVVQAQIAPELHLATLTVHATVLSPVDTVLRLQPRANKPWLAPSPCVQSEDPAIVRAARVFRHEEVGQDEEPRQVVRWVALHVPRSETALPVDAKQGLASGGNSLAHANLCAAMLRSLGIPARTACTMLTWAPAMYCPYWLVQYWGEDGSWQFVDPMIGLTEPMRNSIVLLSIAGPDDEAKSFRAGRLPGVRPGTPYLSVPEVTGDLVGSAIDEAMSAGSISPGSVSAGSVSPGSGGSPSALQFGLHFYRTFPFSAGARVLTAGYRRSSRVIAAARQGHQLPLDDAELQRTLADPERFAVFLDSK